MIIKRFNLERLRKTLFLHGSTACILNRAIKSAIKTFSNTDTLRGRHLSFETTALICHSTKTTSHSYQGNLDSKGRVSRAGRHSTGGEHTLGLTTRSSQHVAAPYHSPVPLFYFPLPGRRFQLYTKGKRREYTVNATPQQTALGTASPVGRSFPQPRLTFPTSLCPLCIH